MRGPARIPRWATVVTPVACLAMVGGALLVGPGGSDRPARVARPVAAEAPLPPPSVTGASNAAGPQNAHDAAEALLAAWRVTDNSGGETRDGVAFSMVAAVDAYCPWYA